MLYKNLIALALCCFCLSSCGGLENKPITEPLSLDERQELAMKDFKYVEVFALIDYVENNKSITSSDTKTMSKLTYRQLNNFLSKWVDRNNIQSKIDAYEEEWTKQFEAYIPKVDSINDEWLAFMKAHNPETYLKLELVDITDKTDIVWGIVKAKIRLTPISGTLSNLNAYFGLDESMLNRNHLMVNETFSDPITREVDMKFNHIYDIDMDKISNLPIDELLKEYSFTTRIDRLTVDGKDINPAEAYFQIPSPITDMWKKAPGKGKEWKDKDDKEFHYWRIITQLIDPSMPSKLDYINTKIIQDAYNDDNVAAGFYYDIAGQK